MDLQSYKNIEPSTNPCGTLSVKRIFLDFTSSFVVYLGNTNKSIYYKYLLVYYNEVYLLVYIRY